MAENRLHAFEGTIPLSTFVTRLICLCMVPLLLMAGWLVFDSARAKQAENDSQAVNLAKNFATFVDDHLSARIGALNMLAVSPLLDDPTRRQDLYQEASGFFQSFGSHVILAEVGMPMRMLFNTRVPFGTDLPLLPQPEGHAAAPTALKTGRPAVGDTFWGPIANEPLVALAVPAMRAGRPVALLLSLIETAHFQARIHEVVLPSGWRLSLQDGRGKIIARQNPEADQGSASRVVIDSKVSPWSVVLEIPQVTNAAQFLAMASALALGILGAALASLLGGILAGRRVGKEVASLAETASIDTPPSKIREVAAARHVLAEAARTRAKAETVLRDSEKNLRLFIEHAPIAIAMFDREMRYLAVSRRWTADYRLGDQDIIGRSHYAVFPEISDAWKAVHQRGLNGEVIEADEDAFVRSDGTIQWLHWVVRPWQADEDAVDGIIILTEDITRRKQAEDELRRTEEHLRLALHGGNLGTWDWNIETGDAVFNQCWAEMLGFKLEEIEPHVRSWEALLHPEDRAKVMERLTAHLEGRTAFYETEHRLRHKSGEWIWVLDKGRVIERAPGGKAVRACGTHLDITVGKRAQEALRESEEKYRRIVETANEGIWAMDEAYRTTFVNPHMSKMLGYTPAEMIGRPVDTFMFTEDLQDHAAKMAVRTHGGGGVYERRFRRKDGGELWAIVSATPLKDVDGHFAGSFGMFTDITAYKQAQASLRESQERFRLVADFTYDWEYWVSPSGRFLYVSPSCERVSGYPSSYFLGESEGLLRIVHPEDRNILASHMRGGLETDTPPCELEFRIIRKDGETRWIKHICWSVFTNGNVYVGRRGSHRDITEEKLAQQAIVESEQRHRAILQTALDGFWLVDMQGRLLQVNQAYCRMSGYSEDELLHMRVSDVEVVESLSDTVDHIRRIRALGEDRFETRHRRKDGRVFDVEVSVQFKPENGGITAAFLRDITDRKSAEESVRESRGKLEAALGSMTDALFICDTGGQFIEFNDAFAKFHRYRSKDECPRKIADFRDVIDLLNANGEQVPVDGRPVPRALRGETATNAEYTLRRKDTSETWIGSYSFAPIRDKAGGVVGAVVVARDITKRKRAEMEIRESEERNRRLIEASADAILVRSKGIIIQVNPAALKLFRAPTEQDLIGKRYIDLVHPDDRAESTERVRKNIEEGWVAPPREHRIVALDGQVVEVESTGVPVRYEGSTQTFGIFRDITERRRAYTEKEKLEAQLQQAQKMESLGTLAGGIAHDFNNILGVIIGSSQLLEITNAVEESSRSTLGSITTASTRAKDLVRQILAFSRHAKQEKILLNLKPIIRETFEFLRASIPSIIELRQQIDAKTDAIIADPTQMQQVLMNLCTNAAHAMEQAGGVLEVGLSNVTLGPGDTRSYPDLEPGGYVRLTVTDTGHGIEPMVMQKIFEPYFTTKEVGKGTGLGLSVVHGIVKAHGGAIKVYSEVGKGTTFQVLLPHAEGNRTDEAKGPQALLGGKERILIVDDEIALVEITRQMLGWLGYEVEIRTSAIEALEAFRKNPGKFDLVITDLTMPQMTGMKLARQMFQIRPDIPIILCTGFSDQLEEKQALSIGIKSFLFKPLVANELAEAVRKALGN